MGKQRGILGLGEKNCKGMYKIDWDERPELREGKIVPIDLCHPTFAMTGALAWQVTKKKT